MKKIRLPVDKAHRILAPRIAYLVTSVDKQGRVNAASFSNLTSVSTDPERLVLAVYKAWDTIRNIRATHEFVVNVPSRNLLKEVWVCGDKYAGNPIPSGIDELKIAGLTEIPSERVKPPRIAECPMHLECKVVWIKNVGDHYLILGDIVSASYSKGSFDKELIQIVPKTIPLMEISRGFFTSPGKVVVVNRKQVQDKVNKALDKMNVKIPKKLKIYEKLRWSEE